MLLNKVVIWWNNGCIPQSTVGDGFLRISSLKLISFIVPTKPVHFAHLMGYRASLDKGAETLTLLDQTLSDNRPVQDFNGVSYPSFTQVG